jgi:tetratricopeptide (TPR) repeat protein
VDPFLTGELVLLVCAIGGSTLFVFVRSVLALRGVSLRRAWRLGSEDLKKGRYEDAERQFRRSAAIATRRFGDRDRRTVALASAVARVLVARERTDEAQSIVDRALAAIEPHAGVADPSLAYVELSAMILAKARGDSRRALEHLDRARVHLRFDPGGVAAIDLERAALLEHSGDRGGAAAVLGGIDPRFVVDHSPSLALSVARARLLQGDAMGAAALYRQLVERERRHQRESPMLACYRALAGDALFHAGKHAEARYALTEALATYDAIASPDDRIVAPLLVVLARTHIALGDLPLAETACRRALTIAASASASGAPYRQPAEPEALASVREEASALLSEVTLPRHAEESRS